MKACTCLLLATAWLLQAGSSAAAQQEPATFSTIAPTGGSPRSAVPSDLTRRYRIQQGDTFEVTFPYVNGFNQTVTVQRDGYVSLRIVGDVKAVGLTLPDLTETLRERYAGTLRDPVLTVELRDFEKPYFVAAGELEHPGKYELRGQTTVMQAVAIAGGFKDRAKKTHVVLFRRGPEGPASVQVQEIDAKRLLEGKQLEDDVQLEAADLIFVSRSPLPTFNTFTSSILPNLGWIVYAIVSHP